MPYVMPTFRSMVRTPWLDLRLKNVPDRWFEIRGVLQSACCIYHKNKGMNLHLLPFD
jgi:hypothetical protein